MSMNRDIQYRRQASGIWQYDFIWKGERIRKSCRTKDARQARKNAEQDICKLIGANERVFFKSTETLFNEYLDHIKKLGRSEATIYNYKRYIERFNRMSYGKRLPELERADIQKWIDYLSGEVAGELYEVDIDGIITNVKTMKKRKAKKIRSNPLSPKTINEHINFVGAVYKFHGLDSPCKQLIRPKTQRERVEEFKAYTQSEVQSILQGAKAESEGKRLRNMRQDAHEYFLHWVTLYAYTGARLGELQFIQYKHIEMMGKTVLILSEKTNKYRRLSFSNPVMWEALMSAIAMAEKHYRRPLQPEDKIQYKYENFFYKHFKSFCKRNHIEWKGDHGLRHAWASFQLLVLNTPIEKVGKMLGHDSLSTTYKTYSHLMGVKTDDFTWGE